MKKIIKDYFTFSRKERTAFIILIVLIGVFIVLPYFVPLKNEQVIVNDELQQQAAQLQRSKIVEVKDSATSNETAFNAVEPIETNYKMFAFNPNTIDAEGWKKLGLRDKTIKTILNYTSKGGKFKNAEDIRKIWGLRKEDADRLIPYIQIENNVTTTPQLKNNSLKQSVSKPPVIIDINVATPQDFFQIPGMDHLIPYRILKYREKLGGFLNVQQVKETYGLTDSVFQSIQPYLKIESSSIKKINLNTTTDYELSSHPYISKDIAKAIVIYRTQHGAYTKVEDIKKIVFIKDDVFQKIAPYLSVE